MYVWYVVHYKMLWHSILMTKLKAGKDKVAQKLVIALKLAIGLLWWEWRIVFVWKRNALEYLDKEN